LRQVAVGLLAAGWLMCGAVQAQETKAVDDLVRQAQGQLQKGQPRDAENTLRKAIDMAPTRGELYMLRSRARDASGKFDAALEDATAKGTMTPELQRAFADPVVAFARNAELVVVVVIIALMVAKPF